MYIKWKNEKISIINLHRRKYYIEIILNITFVLLIIFFLLYLYDRSFVASNRSVLKIVTNIIHLIFISVIYNSKQHMGFL